ncbi:endolytic transglycosylase MltG [Paenalkalicoccus suaedae]|uniref:Endolytic murein transglycosylase n=2 Tax=Paenalkalicoccus suaedae TaxID=2592382 RepID=A0A859FK66_9BACI|nr:endolytic transglycosylase MltG [Paenalkalicoccus suaedae]
MQKHRERIEQKKQEAGLVRKIVFTIFIVLLFVIVGVGFTAYQYVMGAIGPVDEENEDPVLVTIPIGSTTTSIGETLEESGVIESATLFRYYVRFRSESGFQAGDYQLSQAMSVDEIIQELKEGTVYEEFATTFTIPEGFWAEEMFARIGSQTTVEEEELVELAQDREYLEELIERYDMLDDTILELADQVVPVDEATEESDSYVREPLEGYFFPARYDFVEEEITAQMAIEAMLDRMEQELTTLNALNGSETAHQVLTRASIIEGEAQNDEERPIISGVIENRLTVGMPLQMDPTVSYAHGERLSRTLFEDLEIESPYNTYHVTGLPLGPINNPGAASIQAATTPEDHNYLFFYHAPNGEVYFNETLAQHEATVNQFREE